MTKEETLSNLKAYLDGDTAIGNIIPLRSVLESVIKYLSEPSLPSELDETAEEYYLDIKAKPFGGLVKEAFKAGAEWREAQILKLPDNLDDAAWNYVAKKYCIKESEKIFENEEIAEDFKAGAEWLAGQGVKAHCIESANPVSESPDVKLHLITLLYEENEHIPYVRGGDNIDIIIRKK